jgi:hypothetical protein
MVSLPDIGEAVAATGLGDPLLEGESFTGRVGGDGILVTNEGADIEKMRMGGRALG